MTMFRTVTSPLELFFGNPRVLHFPFPLPDGTPSNLTGRTFVWVARRRMLTTPLIDPVPMTLSGDGFYATAPIAAEEVNLIHERGAGYRLDWDVIETTHGASTTRWTGELWVKVSAGLLNETDAAPAWADLPYAEIMAQATTFLLSERGAPGPGLDQWLKDRGDIPEATPELARDKIRQWGGEGAAPFAGEARDARDDAREARDLAWTAEGSARAAEQQTLQDRFQTGQDVLATQTALAQTLSAAQVAAAVANIKGSIPQGVATTAEGGYFTIAGGGVNFVELYQVVNGAAVYRNYLPNGAALDAAVAAVAYAITQRAQLPATDGMEPVLSDDLIWVIPGETSGPATTRSGDFYARQPLSLGGPVLNDFWPHVEAADENGNPLLAVHPEGFAYIPDTIPFLSDTYFYVVVSDDRAILAATPVEEEATPEPDPVATREWSAGVRDGHIWLGAPDTALVRMTDVAGNLTMPQFKGDELSWTDFSSGVGVISRAQLYHPSQFSAGITTVKHILAYGQSTSRGIVLPVVTIGAPDPGRLMMYSQGVNASGNVALPSTSFSTLANASLSVSEVPALSAARQYLSDKGATTGAIVSGHGWTGLTYQQLKKGTVLFSNMIMAMRTSARECTLGGLTYEVDFLDWLHGQADSGAAAGVYLSNLVEIQADVTTAYNELFDKNGEVLFVTSQVSNYTAYNLATVPPMALESLEASILYPDRFISAGPEYQAPYQDGTHFTSAGSLHIGELHGRAARLKKAGLWTGPLYPKIATRTGVVVVVDINQPAGGAPIDFATHIVSDPGNRGVYWHDDGNGNTVTVVDVQITGDFRIAVTLSAVPTGSNGKIGFGSKGTPGQPAGPNSGGRCCIRSAVVETDALGRPLDYFASYRLIPVN